ncbi:MAG: glutamine-hydrolyzing carbamoyl-phosphate synthase small subunit, partial [Saprospiraceae bacterium]
MDKAILLLEDGTIFHGLAGGKTGTTTGEICFNTGMTGYQEVFTDPSYAGQVLVATNVHIGNYGIKDTEIESGSVKIAGFVCRNFNIPYSRALANRSIQDYFEAEGVVAIHDLDTRAIVQHIRERGAMNCIISSETDDVAELQKQLDATPSMAGLELSSRVTTQAPYQLGEADAPLRVAVLDYGVKKNILRCFEARHCYLQVFPAHTSFAEIKAWNPDGYFLSNGPGDPAAMGYAVDLIKQLLADGKPLFGICLGQQLLALAAGLPTYKLHHGHRGLNHPVKNLRTGRSEITSQN